MWVNNWGEGLNYLWDEYFIFRNLIFVFYVKLSHSFNEKGWRCTRDGAFHKSKKLGGFKNWSKLYLAYQLAGCNKFFRNEMVNGAKEFCKSNRNIGRIFKVVDDDVG